MHRNRGLKPAKPVSILTRACFQARPTSPCIRCAWLVRIFVCLLHTNYSMLFRNLIRLVATTNPFQLPLQPLDYVSRHRLQPDRLACRLINPKGRHEQPDRVSDPCLACNARREEGLPPRSNQGYRRIWKIRDGNSHSLAENIEERLTLPLHLLHVLDRRGLMLGVRRANAYQSSHCLHENCRDAI
jgi:hypothetical protein